MTPPYRKLEKALGYRFRRESRLISALTHRSYRFEQEGVELDNQRLEYLGDAAIGLVVAAHLYQTQLNAQEGDLTRMRSRVTSSKPLARMARACGMSEFLLLGRGEEQSGGRERISNLADAMEAVIGAAYIDGGMRAVEKIFRNVMVPFMLEVEQAAEEENPKGRLQEMAQQRWKTTPKYRVISEDGPSHNRSYTVEVAVGGEVYGFGTGANKREAQSRAARQALGVAESLEIPPGV